MKPTLTVAGSSRDHPACPPGTPGSWLELPVQVTPLQDPRANEEQHVGLLLARELGLEEHLEQRDVDRDPRPTLIPVEVVGPTPAAPLEIMLST